MELPTRWRYGFIFRHDFETPRINHVNETIFTFVGNKLMWENAAQMQLVSLNWWQYAGRVWSHANGAHPPNSHLAPKLNINTAHWNNSLHIGGTWYFPFAPTLVACVPASYVQTPLSPMATFVSSGSGCTTDADHDQLNIPPSLPMVDCTPYQDWRATISFIRLDAGINHLDPTVAVGRTGTHQWRYSVSIVSKVPHSVPPPPLTASSPVLQSEPRTSGWTPRPIYPTVKSRLQMVRTDISLPNRRIICIRRRGVQMNGSFWPFREVDGLPVAWRFSSNLQASCNVVGQSLGCVAKKYQ